MRVELHTHTYFSQQTKVLFDGVDSPEDMARHAARLGIDAMVITDHNTMEGYIRAKRLQKSLNMLIIPGEEISSEQGHIIAVGIQEPISQGLPVPETVDQIHAQGGLAISSHPFDIRYDGIREYAQHCDALETFSAVNVDRISNMIARRFARAHHLPGVASSDAHFQAMLGHGVTEVQAHDLDSMLRAIKHGRMTLPKTNSYMPVPLMTSWAVRRLQKSHDYTLQYINDNYHGPKKYISKRMLRLVSKSPGRIDSLFNCMGYVSLGGAVALSVSRNVV